MQCFARFGLNDFDTLRTCTNYKTLVMTLAFPPKFTDLKPCDSRNKIFSSDHTHIMWSMGHMAFRIGASFCKSAPCLMWCPWTFCRWRYNTYNFTRNPTWTPPWGVMRIYGWELLAVCHHLDHKYFDAGYIMFLIGHVTSYKHMFKGHVNLCVETPHGESPPCLVWWLLVWCKWKYKLFNMSRDLTTTRDWKIS